MNWTEVEHFQPHEFICQGIECCGGTERMDPNFVLRLDALRTAYGKPLFITSGYRCPAHNKAVRHSGLTGPHTTGQAADIRIHGRDVYALLRLALQRGFTGIGLKQHGVHGQRFLHLDTLSDAAGQPRPWVWTYK